MNSYTKHQESYRVFLQGEHRLTVQTEESAIKLKEEFDRAEEKARSSILNELKIAQSLLSKGFILVDTNSEIYRQLKVLRPTINIFVQMYHEENHVDQYFTPDLSIVLEKDRHPAFKPRTLM